MRSKVTHCGGAIALVGCLAFTPTWSWQRASTDYTFEDTVGWADTIVIGRVLDSPRIGDYDGRFGFKHPIRVEQYVKGRGPAVLVLETANGCFEVDIAGKSEVQCIMGVPEPAIPEAGTVGIFFLAGTRFAPYGPGFAPIHRDDSFEGEYVLVGVRWPELLDEEGLRFYENERQNPELLKYFRWHRKVPLWELRAFVVQIEAVRREHQVQRKADSGSR